MKIFNQVWILVLCIVESALTEEIKRDRKLFPSSSGQFIDTCTASLLNKRRLYRDDFSVKIFNWVIEDLLLDDTIDTTNLKRLQGSEGHLPHFNDLPKGVISSFVLTTCPLFIQEIKTHVTNADSLPDVIFCREPLKHERCPASVYIPMELVKRNKKKGQVRSLCYNVWNHWDEVVDDCKRHFENENLIYSKAGQASK